MARIRTVKPEICLHDGLYDLEMETGLPIRFAFVGLWMQCDREGRFHWNPRRLKAAILPYDDLDFSRVLHALVTRDFVKKYTQNNAFFGVVPSFKKNQVINNKEKASEIPEPIDFIDVSDASATREQRDDNAFHKERKGKEGKGILKDICQSDQILELWNEICPSLPNAMKLTETRKKKITKRAREDFKTLEDWKKYFEKFEASKFLKGEDGKWKANFDWALEPSNMTKVMEGNYDADDWDNDKDWLI